MKKFKLLTAGFISIFCLAGILQPSSAVAIDLFNNSNSDTPGICQHAEQSGSELPQVCIDNQAQQARSDDLVFGPDGAVAKGLNIFSIVVGIIAVLVLIISGLRLVLAGGDSNSISSARRAILYALIGLVIVAVAQAIVKFLLSRL